VNQLIHIDKLLNLRYNKIYINTKGFMAKSRQKIKARQLRKQGRSIKEIAKLLNISKGSASIWCRDIELTKRQTEALYQNMLKGNYAGRIKGARMQKERKEKKIRYYIEKGLKEISKLNKRELFIAGLALYWGEGSKKNPATNFYNSDPLIIKFMIKWFKEIFHIEDNRFLMYVTINKAHRKRLIKVIKYWSEITSIPVAQFRKPILIKAKNKKIYENFESHYGTLCVRIAKSTNLYYQILGYLNALGHGRK